MLAVITGALLALAASAGEPLFDAAGCRACHRIGGSGGNSGPDLTYVGFRRSKAWLELWLRSPHAWKPDTRMPEFRPRPGALGALAEYLSSLRGQRYRVDPPWRRRSSLDPAERGRVIYDRVGCVACHGPGGAGGHPNNNVPGGAIPPLRDLVGTYTDEELVRRIASGKRPDKEDPSGPEPLVLMPAWREVLGDEDIAAVAAYLRTLAPASGADW